MMQGQLLFILSVSLAVCLGYPNEITTFTTTLKTTSSESVEDTNENTSTSKVESGGRTVIGDIEKLKRIGEILQTVGGKIIPVLVGNSQSTPGGSVAGPSIGAAGDAPPLSSASSEETRNRVRGLQIIHDLKKEVDDITAKNNKT